MLLNKRIHIGKKHFSLAALCACFLIILATGVRFIFILNNWPPTNSDEAEVGLMSLHISQGRNFPFFMYGQAVLGSLEAYIGAGLFLLSHKTALHQRPGATHTVSLEFWNYREPLQISPGYAGSCGNPSLLHNYCAAEHPPRSAFHNTLPQDDDISAAKMLSPVCPLGGDVGNCHLERCAVRVIYSGVKLIYIHLLPANAAPDNDR